MRRTASLLLYTALLLATAWLAPSGSVGRAEQVAAIIATFDVAGEQFRVRIENPATIEQVRALERGESTATIPNGRLLRGSDGNEPWSWHLDPIDIELAEITIELCDGTPSFVEADLDYWVDIVGRFCPWSAVLVSVDPGVPVGGIAELPDAAGTPLETPGSSGPSAGVVAAIAAGTVTFGGAAWYARRRFTRS